VARGLACHEPYWVCTRDAGRGTRPDEIASRGWLIATELVARDLLTASERER
jgi:hypothetical protein